MSESSDPLRIALVAEGVTDYLVLQAAIEAMVPLQTVLFTPSKSTESWVLAACFPADAVMTKLGWECYHKPENRLAQQAKAERFAKNQRDYAARHAVFKNGWMGVVAKLPEAARFQRDFVAMADLEEIVVDS